MAKFLVSVIGNLVSDPILKSGDSSTWRARLACNYRESKETSEVIFLNLVGIPDYLIPYLVRGTGIHVVGAFWPSAYTDNGGVLQPGGTLFVSDINLLYQPKGEHDTNS